MKRLPYAILISQRVNPSRGKQSRGLILLGITLILASCQTSPGNPVSPQEGIIATIKKEFFQGNADQAPAEERRYAYATADLNEDGDSEYLVALPSSGFCGSGGCTVLILNKDFSLNTKITVADFPITLSIQNTQGWKDLITWSDHSHRKLKWQGKAYTTNASMGEAMSEAERERLKAADLLPNPFADFHSF